jgi:hypothetical protein
MVEAVEIAGRTFHLRATMRALRNAKTQDGVDIQTLGGDPLDIVVLCYHFACAGAQTQGTELTMSRDEFEDIVTPADLPTISAAMEKVMAVPSKKK